KPHTDITWSFKLKVVHKVALFRDNKNVYLHVKMSETNYTQFNGYEYRFIYDGTEVVFAAVYDNGNIKKLGNGIYKLTVRTQQNYIPVSTGYLTRKSGESDSAEIVIPISAFGNGINLEGVKTIEFYSPNLGPQHVICTGTSSGPYIAVGLGFLIVCVGYLNFKKKRKKA
ncbi:MAG TPA: Firmicu-CTERM sorting domain-containing protein, partial [Clostridium sp.]